MKKTTHPIANIGSVSLLMIFIVLCLVVFSALSLSGTLSEIGRASCRERVFILV